LGAEVSVLGRDDSKKQDAMDFGAKEFLVTDEQFEQKLNHFDLVLNSASANLGVDKFLKILKPEGVLVMLGFQPRDQILIRSMLFMPEELSLDQMLPPWR